MHNSEEYSPFIQKSADSRASAPLYPGNIQLIVPAHDTVYPDARNSQTGIDRRSHSGQSRGLDWTIEATWVGLKESNEVNSKLQISQISGELLASKEHSNMSHAHIEGRSASDEVYRNIMRSNRQELDFSIVPQAFAVPVDNHSIDRSTSSVSSQHKGYEIKEYTSTYDEKGKPPGYLVNDYKSAYD